MRHEFAKYPGSSQSRALPALRKWRERPRAVLRTRRGQDLPLSFSERGRGPCPTKAQTFCRRSPRAPPFRTRKVSSVIRAREPFTASLPNLFLGILRPFSTKKKKKNANIT